MKIKKGDKVKVIAGRDLGKTGKVLQVFPDLARASVEGVNISVKHLRGSKGVQRQAGQKIEFPSPIMASNLMLVCGKCGKASRVAFTRGENGKKNRVCRKCKEVV